MKVASSTWALLFTSVVLLGCSLLGGSSNAADDLRSYVERKVADVDRRMPMLAAVDAIEAAIDDYNTVSQQAGDALQQLNRNYDATRAQFDELMARHNGAREAARDGLLASVLSLRELTTPAEWGEIAEFEIRAMQERLALAATTNDE